MVKRFPTRCRTCGHCNILRVTLGADVHQEHTLECMGCGGTLTIRLELDFVNRERLRLPDGTDLPGMSSPSIASSSLENADFCDEREGTVTNLDPTFLVPDEMLHQDGVFTWMYAARQFTGALHERPFPRRKDGRKFGDIIDGVGILRHQGDVLNAFLKAWQFNRRGRDDLVQRSLESIQRFTNLPIVTIEQAAATVAQSFRGVDANAVTEALLEEAEETAKLNPAEYQRLRNWMAESSYQDMPSRHVEVMSDYARGYSQFCQTWLYVAKDVNPDQVLQPATRDLRTVGMFYGTAFEHLSSGLALPAALNNIRNGRPFDAFQNMDMKKYLSIDKAGRAKCFEGNARLAPLAKEFDSTIRNASHHGGFRLRQGTIDTIEYRTGDGGQWKTIRYVDYLIRCNRIFAGMMQLLMLHIFVTRIFE